MQRCLLNLVKHNDPTPERRFKTYGINYPQDYGKDYCTDRFGMVEHRMHKDRFEENLKGNVLAHSDHLIERYRSIRKCLNVNRMCFKEFLWTLACSDDSMHILNTDIFDPLHDELIKKFEEKQIPEEDRWKISQSDCGDKGILPPCLWTLLSLGETIGFLWHENTLAWTPYKDQTNLLFENKEKSLDRIVNPDLREIAKESLELEFVKKPGKIITHDNQLKSFPRDEARELLSISNANPEVRLWQVFSYFTRHWDRLESSDYQLFFELVCLNYLNKELKKNPGAAVHMMQFVAEGLPEFKADNQFSAYLFLVKFGLRIQKTCVELGIYTSHIIDWEREIEYKLEQYPEGSKEKASLIYLYALSTFKLDSKKISNQNLNKVILSRFLHENLALEKTVCPAALGGQLEYLMREQKDVVKEILDHPEFRNDIFNKVIHTILKIDFPKGNWEEISFPFYRETGGNWTINVYTGEIATPYGPLKKLPEAIRISSAVSNVLDPKYLCPFIQNTFRQINRVYTSVDGTLRILGDSGIILSNLWGKFYRYISPEAIGKSTLPSQLREGFTHWMEEEFENPDLPHMIIRKKEGDEQYKVVFGRKQLPDGSYAYPIISIRSINARGEATPFELANFSPGSGSTLAELTNLTPAGDIRALRAVPGSSSAVQQTVTLFEYGLNFIVDASGRLYSQKHPGYYVSDSMKERQFTEMPYLKKYLILRNDEGQRKMLLPLQKFIKGKKKNKLFNVEEKSTLKNEVVYEISLDHNGVPMNVSPAANLYLAYAAYVHKDYTLMQKHLKAYSDSGDCEENPILTLMYDWGLSGNDVDPQGLGLLLNNALELIQRIKYKSASLDWVDFNELIGLYYKYHRADKNSGMFRLPLHREKALLEIMYSHVDFTSEEALRLMYLRKKMPLERKIESGKEADVTGYHPKLAIQGSTFSEAMNIINEWSKAVEDLSTIPSQPYLPEKYYEPGFLFFPYFLQTCLAIEELRNNPEALENAKQRAAVCKYSANPGTQWLSYALLDILKDDSSYDELLKKLKELCQCGKKNYEFDRWLSNVLSKVAKSISPVVAAPKVKQDLPITLDSSLGIEQRMAVVLPAANSGLLNVTNFFESVEQQNQETMPPLSEEEASPLLKRTIVEFNKNLETYKAQKLQNPAFDYHIKSESSLPNIETYLKDISTDKTSLLEKKKMGLIFLANTPPSSTAERLRWDLEKTAKDRKDVDLNELILMFLKGSDDDFSEKCPGLNQEARNRLNQEIFEYLLLATEVQQLERSLGVVKDINGLLEKLSGEENEARAAELKILYGHLINKLANEMGTSRQYDPSERREYLVFEHAANILLRANQVKTLKTLYDHTKPVQDNATEVVAQLIMGEGKSKVLLPILAFNKANGRALSMIIVPGSLYETNRDDLKKTSKKNFGQEPQTLDFNRSSPFTVDSLRSILWDLQRCVVDKNYLITTAESLQSLELKYWEAIYQASHGEVCDEVKKKIEIMEEILDLIETRGEAIVDEGDIVLHSNREVNFPVGKPKQIPKVRIRLFREMMNALHQIDFGLRDNLQEKLTSESYKNEIAPIIADHLINKWALTDIDPQTLRRYLLGEDSGIACPVPYEHPKSVEISLAKEVLTSILPLTLSKSGNESYGLSKETKRKFSINYKGNNTPDEKTQHGNLYETMFYSTFIYLQNGLKEEHVDELITAKRQEARLEARLNGIKPQETVTSLKFANTFGVPDLFNISAEERLAIAQSVRWNKAALDCWLEDFVYPEVTIYTQKLSANGLDLVAGLRHVQVVTGIPWNRGTFDKRLVKPERDGELMNPGSEIEVMEAIWRKVEQGKEKPLIHPSKGVLPREKLAHILEDHPDFDCLIDVGAEFKGMTNDEVAAEMLASRKKDPTIKGIARFDKNNTVGIMGTEKEIPLENIDPHERNTYYDQVHTTGTDLEQKMEAKAILTAGDKPIRDWVQGAMRMRKLKTTQQIEIIADHPNTASLYRRGFEVQSRMLGNLTAKSAKQKLAHIAKHHLKETVKKTKDFSTKIALFKLFEDVITDKILDDPYQEFGQPYSEQDALRVLESQRQKQIQIIEHLLCDDAIAHFSMEIQESLKTLRQEILALIRAETLPAADEIPEKLPTDNSVAHNMETQVEVEKEIELEVEEGIQEIAHSINDSKEWLRKNTLWGPASDPSDPRFFLVQSGLRNGPDIRTIESYIEKSPETQCFKRFFDPRIHTTPNFMEQVNEPLQAVFEPYFQQRAYQVVQVKDKGELKLIMMDVKEVGQLLKLLRKKHNLPPGTSVKFLDLATGINQHFGTPFEEADRQHFEMLTAQAKFFNGLLTYTHQEERCLRDWLSGNSKARELFELIMKCHPGAFKLYKKSRMRRILENLRSPAVPVCSSRC